MADPIPEHPPAFRRFLEPVGLVVLAGLFVFFAAASWRKWPDPVIDFGLQLATPWRILHGAVLYRDLDYLYGPFSSYFNAALFAAFGTGMMTLACANMAIFALILAATYLLFRAAWGRGLALISVALYVSVFGFSQFSLISNYNYVTPYSHETTHGILVCLVLASLLLRWIDRPSAGLSFAASLFYGLTWVLKPEYILSGTLLTAAAVILRVRLHRSVDGRRHILPILLGAILPTLAFTLWFLRFMPPTQAFEAAANAWLLPLTTPMPHNLEQLKWLGLDQPAMRVGAAAVGVAGAGALLACIAVAVWLPGKFRGQGTLASIGLCLALALFSSFGIEWIQAGLCLPTLAGVYLAIAAWKLLRTSIGDAEYRSHIARFFVALIAASLISRMLINGRLYQFGCFQAALTAIMVPAVVIAELPGWIGAARAGRCMAWIATLCLILPGAFLLCRISLVNLAYKTFPIGRGPDLFYAMSPQVDGVSLVFRQVVESIEALGPNQTLAVLPEGSMVNYLTRLPAPYHLACDPFSYFNHPGEEARELRQLQAAPPTTIVILSRDLRSYGVARYGAQLGEGQAILDWIGAHYDRTATIGGDPLDPDQRGAWVYRRRDRLK